MIREEVIEYVEYALRCAKIKCDTLEEAEDISQEVLLELLVAIEEGKEIQYVKGWISSVTERKYIDYIRKKQVKSNNMYAINTEDIILYEDPSENIIKSEDYLEIRKRIASLSRIYRDVIIEYYLKNKKIKK